MLGIRKQVRQAVKTLLDSIPNVTVYSSRVYPKGALPCISVFTLEEAADEEAQTMGGSDYRIISIAIEISEKATTLIDDQLDDLSVLVETQINTDKTLSGLIQCLNYVGTTIELSGDAEMPIGVATLNYTALT